MISGLEDIARSVGRPPNFQSRPILPVLLDRDDTPPPYSLTVCHSSRRNTQLWSLSLDSSSDRQVNIDGNSEVTSSSASVQRHLFAMEAYLASFPPSNAHMAPRARDKLLELSHLQFMELCLDVYDELLRRQNTRSLVSNLCSNGNSFLRDEMKPAGSFPTLVTHRFGHPCGGYHFRKLDEGIHTFSTFLAVSTPPTQVFLNVPKGAVSIGQQAVIERMQRILYPLLTTALSTSPLLARTEESQSDPAQNDGNSDIFTSYRVKLDDLCSTVLPAALRKYASRHLGKITRYILCTATKNVV